jgi:hypothetical protein
VENPGSRGEAPGRTWDEEGPKDPLYGPPASGTDTSALGKGVRFPQRRREGGSQQKAEEERKDGTSFEKSAPRVNLFEKGQQLITEQEKLKSFQGFLPNEGSGGACSRPPDDCGSRAGERFTL